MHYKFFLSLLILINLHAIGLHASASEALAKLEFPKDFKVEIFIDNIDSPRQIAESPEGNLFIGSKNGGVIYAISPDKSKRIIAQGLKYSTGVTFYDGDLYFSEIDSIWKIENIDNELINSPLIPEKVLVTNNLPNNPWHGWKWIDFGPDGKLYLAVGVPCNVCNPSQEEEYNFVNSLIPE